MQLQPAVMVVVPPGAMLAMDVLRQRRSRLYAYGTRSDWKLVPLTMKKFPVTAFSGRPPSAGGLKRGSRQVPVHAGLTPAARAASTLARAPADQYSSWPTERYVACCWM